MRGGKGIVDKNVAELRQGRSKLRIVLLFALVEPQVLQHGDTAGLQRRHSPLRRLADAIV